jgi:hypothetical protein
MPGSPAGSGAGGGGVSSSYGMRRRGRRKEAYSRPPMSPPMDGSQPRSAATPRSASKAPYSYQFVAATATTASVTSRSTRITSDISSGKGPDMQRWEYMTWTVSPDRGVWRVYAVDQELQGEGAPLPDALAEAGAGGWELVAAYPMGQDMAAYIFKRPLAED